MITEPIWKSGLPVLVPNYCYSLATGSQSPRRRGFGSGSVCSYLEIIRTHGEVAPGLVYRAIRRLAIDWARSIDRRSVREQKTYELSPLSSAFEDNLEKDERQQALLRAVDRLPEQQKEVLTLKIWGELTFDEIARTLDISLNTVASRYRYALQKLKDWVPEELDKPNPQISP